MFPTGQRTLTVIFDSSTISIPTTLSHTVNCSAENGPPAHCGHRREQCIHMTGHTDRKEIDHSIRLQYMPSYGL